MITLDDVQHEWTIDSKIDPELLDEESIKIPQLHSKYLKYLSDVKLLKIKKDMEYRVLLREKFEYYTGKSDPAVYQLKPFNLKILKADVQQYIESDEEWVKANQKVKYLETIVDFLDRTIRQISNRTFTIKNAIDWRKFTSGAI